MAGHSDAAEAEIARIQEGLGLTRDEAIVYWINSHIESAKDDPLSFEEVEEYDRQRDQAHINGVSLNGKAQDRPARFPMRWGELAAKEPPNRTWLVDQWLTTGSTLIAGPGGTGKSLVAQILATALSLGQPYIGAVPTAQRVLTWACEDEHDELWRRQIAICNHFGIGLGGLPDGYILEPRLGRSNGLTYQHYGALAWTPLYAELRDQVNDYRATVLILDNIGQIFGGQENDRHHVTEFLNGLLALAKWPLSVILLGHPAKAAGSEYSGSTAWQNAVRMRWFMGDKLPDQQQSEDEEQADPNVRFIAKRKANYTVHDYRKLVWANGVYVPESVPEVTFQEKYGRRDEAAEACVLSGMARLAGSGVHPTASRGSSDYLPKLFLSSGLANGFTKQELTSAMNRLRAAGTIGEIVIGKYSNRSPKYGLGVKT